MTRVRLRRRARGHPRRGAVAVEVALLLSGLCLPCLMAVNLAVNFHTATLIDNCARNGALAWADARIARQLNCVGPTGVVDVQKAARTGVEHLNPPPAVTSTFGTDSAGKDFIKVTVQYPPPQQPGQEPPSGLFQGVSITRTAWMMKLPTP